MVKDFIERERERAKEKEKADAARMDDELRANANAVEWEKKIVDYMALKGITGIDHKIDPHDNHVTLTRSTGTLEIYFREIGERMAMAVEREGRIVQRQTGGSGTRPSLQDMANNQDRDWMKEKQLQDAVIDWLKQT
jgi:hypothetical protein